MIKVDMYYTVRTLIKNSKINSEIARLCDIDRKTARKIRKRIQEGTLLPLKNNRKHKLEELKEIIKFLLGKGFWKVSPLKRSWIRSIKVRI